jgi:hypothetical protein
MTVDGDKALELVQRGDIDGCSFIYSTDEDDSENAVSYEKLDEKDDKGNNLLLRHVKRIDAVYDFTITPDPAFEQTEVTRREVEDAGIILPEAEAPEKESRKIDYGKKREALKAVYKRINHTV